MLSPLQPVGGPNSLGAHGIALDLPQDRQSTIVRRCAWILEMAVSFGANSYEKINN